MKKMQSIIAACMTVAALLAGQAAWAQQGADMPAGITYHDNGSGSGVPFRGTFDGLGHTVSGIRIYKGGTTTADGLQDGTFVSMKNATLTERLGVSLSATEIATAW